MSKTEKYIFVVAAIAFTVCILGAIAFIFTVYLPTPLVPIWQTNTIFGLLTVTFPWFNWVSILGLVLLFVASIARLIVTGKKKHVYTLFAAAIIICLALTMFGISLVGNNNQPPPNSWYPTPTPYPTWTPPPTQYPTYSPYPTSDPTAWSITQLYETEYVSGSYYYPPTSYRTVANVEPVISYSGYSHQVDTWGTYQNWDFDVYYKEEGTNVWHYGDSGTTSAGGHGVAYIPIDSSMSRETFTVVAFLDPTDFNYDNYFANDVSDAAVANAIAAGTCRASNFLTFTVEVQYVL